MNNFNYNDNNYDMNQNNNDMTLIGLQRDQQMGVDMSSFNNDTNVTMHGVSTTKDLPIIEEINQQSSNFKGIMKKRANSLKMIANSWAENNIGATIKTITL